MRYWIIPLAVATQAIIHSPASACDCPGKPETPEALARASAVVAVTVLSVGPEEDPPSPPGLRPADGGRTAGGFAVYHRLRVDRAWKGAHVGDTLVIRRPMHGSSRCDYWLEAGTKHLLYLLPYVRYGETFLDSAAKHCGRSSLLEYATSEIAALDNLVPSAKGSAPAVTAPPGSSSRQRFGCSAAPGSGSGSGHALVGILGALAWLCWSQRRRHRGALR